MSMPNFIDISNCDINKIDDYFDVYHVSHKGRNLIYKYNKSFNDLYMVDNYFGIATLDYMYREIIISYLAKFAGINSVNPHFAKYNNRYGLIEENYNEDGYQAYSGLEIMEHFMNYIEPSFKEDDDEDKKKYILETLNNLETIKKAFKYYFRNYEDSDELVDDLYHELVKRFFFDVITSQKDRTLGNWSLLINKSSAKFTKMYDNEEAFINKGLFEMTVKVPNEELADVIKNIYECLDQEYINLFEQMVETLSPTTLENAIFRAEMDVVIDKKIKSSIISSYSTNYDNILSYMKKYRGIGKH